MVEFSTPPLNSHEKCPFEFCTLHSIFGTCRYSKYNECEDWLKWEKLKAEEAKDEK